MMKHLFKYLSVIVIRVITGITTIFLIPSQYDILIWIVLIVVLGYVSNSYFHRKIFWNAFALSVLVGISITATHLLFIDSYTESHKAEIATLDNIKTNNSYRITLLLIAPIYWFILGALSGLSALFYNKMRTKMSSPNR